MCRAEGRLVQRVSDLVTVKYRGLLGHTPTILPTVSCCWWVGWLVGGLWLVLAAARRAVIPSELVLCPLTERYRPPAGAAGQQGGGARRAVMNDTR